jgi:HD-GYP domain-containing protein (c-di-GMP phosphodiesterase class II)
VIAAGLLLAAAFVAGLVGALAGLMWPSLLGLALFAAFAVLAYRAWLHRGHGVRSHEISDLGVPVGAEPLNGDAAPSVDATACPASPPAPEGSDVPAPVSPSEPPPCAVHFQVPPTLEAPAVVASLLEGARSTSDAVAAHLWLLDPSTATLRLIAAAGPLAPPAIPVPVDDASLGAAVTRGSAVLVPPAAPDHGDEPAAPIRFRFAVPVSAGAARGVAAVDIVSATTPDTGALIALFSQGAGLLAGSLALHVARDETRQSRLLTEASRDLTRRVDEAALVHRALDRAVELSSAATGSVMLIDGETGRMRIVASVGLPEEVVASTDVAEGDGIAGWVLATRKPMLVEDLPGSETRGVSRHGVRSALSVPVLDEDGALGVINVGSRGYPARFTDRHTEALETLAAQLAVALRNARAMRVTEDLYFGTLRALAMAMETKDPFSHGATERIAVLAEALGAEMDMTVDEREALRVAALLHDIGMEAAGEAVRSADRPLTLTERGLLTMHPVIAADILREVPALKEVAPIVYHHHERFDGTGYVGGLSGDDIPLGSRIIAVLDSYTAMTSPRPWRGARSTRESLHEIKHNAGTQFDPRVVDAFCALVEREPELVSGDQDPEVRARRA